MVKTISLDALVSFSKKLEKIFCDANKPVKRYAKVWLTDEDFAGLPNSEKYIINVQTASKIDSCVKEMKYITTELLGGLTKEEMAMFWGVNVYNADDEMACQECFEAQFILSDENSCS